MNNYSKRFVEVNDVLNHLSEENYKKIPIEIISLIKENMDTNYYWKYNETLPLYKQNLSKDTIAILSYINMNYLLTYKQKEELEIIHKKNDIEIHNKLKIKYNSDDLFKKAKKQEINSINKNVSICIIEKEKFIIERIKDFLKKIFKL